MRMYSRAGALIMASILGASVAMTGCERVGSESVVEERNNDDKDRADISDEIKEDISEAYATMGYQLLSESLRDNDGSSNVMISPTSVAFALDMAAMGAEGDTYDNMADILSGGATKSEIDSYVRGYLASIEDDDALKIAAATVMGSGELCLKTGLHPAVLKDQVCSPGGTTICGVMALEENGLRNAVIKSVLAADEKTKLMAGGK